jgi:bifunctional isochorismate lyase/aryl carrier protein
MTDATHPLTLDTMRADIARILHEDPSEIGDDDSLIDLGLDSIRAMALVTRWRDAGAAIEFSELAENARLSHWWAVVERALARRAGQ